MHLQQGKIVKKQIKKSLFNPNLSLRYHHILKLFIIHFFTLIQDHEKNHLESSETV